MMSVKKIVNYGLFFMDQDVVNLLITHTAFNQDVFRCNSVILQLSYCHMPDLMYIVQVARMVKFILN